MPPFYFLGVYGIRPPLPAVGGGEGVGVVTLVGAEVTTLSKGDWVVMCRPGMGKTWSTALTGGREGGGREGARDQHKS